MNWWTRRRLRKQVKESLHAARHARHMREDIASPERLEALAAAEERVRKLASGGDPAALAEALERLDSATDLVYPFSLRKGIRENVEVIIVALAAAMAIRAYFFQPFKIPTGSMQPTLNGILARPKEQPDITDRFPLKILKWAVTGEWYREIRVQRSGRLEGIRDTRKGLEVKIAGVVYRIPHPLARLLEKTVSEKEQEEDADSVRFYVDPSHALVFKRWYEEGERLVGGEVIAGDHVIVDKMRYNFVRPKRGQVVVFDTRHINHRGVEKGTFYIKRLIGLPGEKIQIRNGEILVNGKPVRSPEIFRRFLTDPGYHGHTNAGRLATPEDAIVLGPKEYLMMGDNTLNSLDGRYFGAVPAEDLQGPAVFVYWPFRSHWGPIP